MAHQYYSQRTGLNPHPDGLPLREVIDLFVRVYQRMQADGYFTEAFGYECVDAGRIEGKIVDVELEILLAVRKRGLWPVHLHADSYSEDDFFDVIEFLYQQVSKPIDGTYHSWGDCGMHWVSFSKLDGELDFCNKVNEVLAHYEKPFELSPRGEILQKPQAGFERIFAADLPTKNHNVLGRVESAISRFRRHGSTVDDRRQAVRDLADILEYLRPQLRSLLTAKDEGDLFNIVNNFGIRHHNDIQKTSYDSAVWLNWMFYVFLATVHAAVRKIGRQELENPADGAR